MSKLIRRKFMYPAGIGATSGSVSVGAVGTTVAASNLMKFNYGNYMVLDTMNYGDSPARRTANFAQMDTVANNANIAGFHIKHRWGALEGPTAGNYSRAFDIYDAYIAKLASMPVLSRPKRIKFCVAERSFATSNVAPFYPEYYTNYLTGNGELTSTARINEAATMDRLIALSQGLAARYESNPWVEMYMMEGETANSIITNDQVGINTQMKRWMTASRAAWPRTRLKCFPNFHYPCNLDLYEHAIITRVMMGGPDPELRIASGGTIDGAYAIDANEWFRGLGRLGQEAWHAPVTDPLGYSTKDYREILGWAAEQQSLGFSPVNGYSTEPLQIWEFQVNTMHARDIDWNTDDSRPISTQRWTTGTLPMLNSVNGRVYEVSGVTPRPTCW